MSTHESDFYFHPGILPTLQQNSEWWLPFSPRILELVACASSTPCLRTFPRVHPVVERGTSTVFTHHHQLRSCLRASGCHVYWLSQMCSHPSPRWIPRDRLQLQGGLLYRLECGKTPLFTSSDTRTTLVSWPLPWLLISHEDKLFPNMVKRFSLKNTEWVSMIFSTVDRWWRHRVFPLYYNWSDTVYVQKASFILLVTTLWVLVGFFFFLSFTF